MVTRSDFWQLLRGSGADLEATIAGSSMLPTLPDAARVRIRPSAADAYVIGDIVVCVLKDELYAHRVVRRGRAGDAAVLVTIGDNRRLCDPPARARDVLGSIDSCWRNAQWEALSSPPARPASQRWAIAANAWVLTACARISYGLARRLQGLVLHASRLPLRFRPR
jgi:hypothetical protein